MVTGCASSIPLLCSFAIAYQFSFRLPHGQACSVPQQSYLSLLTADASYYLTRNSLNYVTPVMMQDKALALSYTQIGGLTSILPVAYGKANPPQ